METYHGYFPRLQNQVTETQWTSESQETPSIILTTFWDRHLKAMVSDQMVFFLSNPLVPLIEKKVLQEPPFIWEFVATPLGHTPVRVVVADQPVPKLVCPRQGQKTQQIRTESEPYRCWDCGVMTIDRFLWTLNTGPGGLRRHRMVVPESMRSHGRPLSLRHGNLGPLSGVCSGCSGFFCQVPVV